MDATGLEALGYLATKQSEPSPKWRWWHAKTPIQATSLIRSTGSWHPLLTTLPTLWFRSPSEDNARRMLGSRKEEDSVWTYPLETQHIHEAMRRLSQRPVSALGWHRRLETRKTPMTLVAI